MNATYSPDDNKLRLYASGRLDPETFERVKAAGFRWAPKQELFVAPAWSPEREDLLLELCGEVGDEDTSLADRAEERAERFEDYSEKRAQESAAALDGVRRLADGIPLGQPILIGHHSERHARKDAERITNGMRRGVNLWQTSVYWTDRAAGALRHAKYKELPAVRARRIKGLEADLRKVEGNIKRARAFLELWGKLDGPGADGNPCTPELLRRRAVVFANQDSGYYAREFTHRSGYVGPLSLWEAAGGNIDGADPETTAYATPYEIRDRAIAGHEEYIGRGERWAAHYRNRLAYERALLAEAGGLLADRATFEVGGRVLRRGSWYVVTRVNPGSVSVAGHFAATITHDEITDYRPPTAEETALVAKATKAPPLCNYPGEGFRHLTRAELAALPERRWSDFSKTMTIKATETHGTHRVPRARGHKAWDSVGVYVTDQKRKDPPALTPTDGPSLLPWREPRPEPTPAEAQPAELEARAVRDALRNGSAVQVVSAPQLFPTPAQLAREVVERADIQPGQRILESSAGTGALLDALPALPSSEVVAVEINNALCRRLNALPVVNRVVEADFLSLNGELGTFDRVVMNPPFTDGADIKHIEHARHMLKPGGRLVAICANGPRQRERLQPIAREWVDLPAGSFKASGTNVNAALVVIDAPTAEQVDLFGAAALLLAPEDNS